MVKSVLVEVPLYKLQDVLNLLNDDSGIPKELRKYPLPPVPAGYSRWVYKGRFRDSNFKDPFSWLSESTSGWRWPHSDKTPFGVFEHYIVAVK